MTSAEWSGHVGTQVPEARLNPSLTECAGSPGTVLLENRARPQALAQEVWPVKRVGLLPGDQQPLLSSLKTWLGQLCLPVSPPRGGGPGQGSTKTPGWGQPLGAPYYSPGLLPMSPTWWSRGRARCHRFSIYKMAGITTASLSVVGRSENGLRGHCSDK